MVTDKASSKQIHLLWVYSGSLAAVLDSATWLETVKNLRRSGWRVTLVAAGQQGTNVIGGVEVLCIARVEVYLLRHLVFYGRLLRLILRQWKTVDVVLFHETSVLWLLPVRIVRNMTGARRPLLVLDIRTLFMPGRLDLRGFLRKIFRNLSMSASQWVDGYLTITARMADSLRIPPERLWGVWPSGVEPGRFIPARKTRRWPLAEPIRLVYIGSLHYERNLLTLCRAVGRANEAGMAFQLILIGDGTQRGELEQFAAGNEAQVQVIPPVPHENISGFLARAHVGVLPFPDEEKFRVSSPIKLFEYMAAGMPVLATRIACHTDVVGDGNYVFWAEDAGEQGLLEALRKIWRQQARLSEMGDQAALAVKSWSWAESAKKLRKALESGLRPCDDGERGTDGRN